MNRPSAGFEDVQDAQEPDVSQVLELSQEDVTIGRRVPLRFVRFQSVNSIHVGYSNPGHEFLLTHSYSFLFLPTKGGRMRLALMP